MNNPRLPANSAGALFFIDLRALPSPFSCRRGSAVSHALISFSNHIDLFPTTTARGNSPARIQAQTVGNVTPMRASTAFLVSNLGGVFFLHGVSHRRCPLAALSAALRDAAATCAVCFDFVSTGNSRIGSAEEGK